MLPSFLFIINLFIIIRNPVHHGFRDDFAEWEHSSFFDIVEMKTGTIEIEKLLKTFGGRDKFMALHNQNLTNFKMSDQPVNKKR